MATEKTSILLPLAFVTAFFLLGVHDNLPLNFFLFYYFYVFVLRVKPPVTFSIRRLLWEWLLLGVCFFAGIWIGFLNVFTLHLAWTCKRCFS